MSRKPHSTADPNRRPQWPNCVSLHLSPAEAQTQSWTPADTLEETRLVEGSQSAARAELPAQLGRYAIEALLGEGSFGRVYAAYDPELRRPVAIKVPARSLFQTSGPLQRFLQEARTAAQLRHPGLVAVFDVQTEAGCPFIVQERAERGDFRLPAGIIEELQLPAQFPPVGAAIQR